MQKRALTFNGLWRAAKLPAKRGKMSCRHLPLKHQCTGLVTARNRNAA
jgi:hypothetical protein